MRPNSNPLMTYAQHFRKNLQLALPVMITQAGQIMVNVADNVMVGGLGGKWDVLESPDLAKQALGAVSLGNGVFFTIMVLAMGFSFAMSPLVAQADAKNNIDRGANILTHGLVLNMVITTLLVGVLFLFAPFMRYMGQPEQVVEMAIPYLQIIAVSMLPLMIFQSFRQVSEGLSLTLVVTVATLIANGLNILFNYGFIFGHWGFPRWEVDGAGVGTLLSRVIMVFTLVTAMWLTPKSRKYLKRIQIKKFKSVIFRKLIQLGAPTAMQMFFEVGVFSVAAFICGKAGEDDLAAHQIALNMASISFMLCIGLGIAATVRVGNQMGLKSYSVLKRVGWSVIFMVVVFMFVCGLIMIVFRYQLPEFYIDNQEVIHLAAQLLIVAALFQLSDGVQVVVLGVLRGMQDVNIPVLITFIAYFVIALPLGYYLALVAKMGALGMWIGLGAGLTFSAILLLIRYYRNTQRLGKGEISS